MENCLPGLSNSKKALNILSERRSRLLLLTMVDLKNAAETADTIDKLLKKLL
ncbi:MAG TPA: hypothetical protein VMM54_06545 [Nitrospirota bacterium]|nr:hypothetical protein [Nitrospirota bacterium]